MRKVKATHDIWWLRMPFDDYAWHLMATHDIWWLRMTFDDYAWHLMTTHDIWWLRMTFDDYAWHLNKITENWRVLNLVTFLCCSYVNFAHLGGKNMTSRNTQIHTVWSNDTFIFVLLFFVFQLVLKAFTLWTTGLLYAKDQGASCSLFHCSSTSTIHFCDAK